MWELRKITLIKIDLYLKDIWILLLCKNVSANICAKQMTKYWQFHENLIKSVNKIRLRSYEILLKSYRESQTFLIFIFSLLDFWLLSLSNGMNSKVNAHIRKL